MCLRGGVDDGVVVVIWGGASLVFVLKKARMSALVCSGRRLVSSMRFVGLGTRWCGVGGVALLLAAGPACGGLECFFGRVACCEAVPSIGWSNHFGLVAVVGGVKGLFRYDGCCLR